MSRNAPTASRLSALHTPSTNTTDCILNCTQSIVLTPTIITSQVHIYSHMPDTSSFSALDTPYINITDYIRHDTLCAA